MIVTGFRASLADALQNKRESNQIIESVSAEDIGKFPDQNVAESLQRLPGISIDHSNGQGTKARIRGLDQNVTLLNDDIFLSGLELYTQGEGNVRKADSLEGIPSELLGGIDVYKSPNASQSESGLGGVINLKTRSPFALGDGLTLAGNLRYADSGEGWEPLGALVSVTSSTSAWPSWPRCRTTSSSSRRTCSAVRTAATGGFRIAMTARRYRRTTSRPSIAMRLIVTRSANAWARRSRWHSVRPKRPSSKRNGSTPICPS